MESTNEELEMLKNEVKELKELKEYFDGADKIYLDYLKTLVITKFHYETKVQQSCACRKKIDDLINFFEAKVNEAEKKNAQMKKIKTLDEFSR